MVKPPWKWDESDVLKLITNGVPEGIDLEYKACDALTNTDRHKTEISKDVSALANSAGGTIVYGIREMDNVAVAFDVGFDPQMVTKEWLEQVIHSRIQRRIDGIRINPVEIKTASPERFVYVVYVPQSNRAPHQAYDKKFYKRYNFNVLPMEEYEIRDVSRRNSRPELKLIPMVEIPNNKPEGHVFLRFVIINQSQEMALYALFDIFLPNIINVIEKPPELHLVEVKGFVMSLNEDDTRTTPAIRLQRVWKVPDDMPIFDGAFLGISDKPLELFIPNHIAEEYPLTWQIRAPGFNSGYQKALLRWTTEGPQVTILNQ